MWFSFTERQIRGNRRTTNCRPKNSNSQGPLGFSLSLQRVALNKNLQNFKGGRENISGQLCPPAFLLHFVLFWFLLDKSCNRQIMGQQLILGLKLRSEVRAVGLQIFPAGNAGGTMPSCPCFI